MSAATDEEDDLRLVRASASLLADLETSLPKALWQKTQRKGDNTRKIHKTVKQKHLKYLLDLIEPFQAEPQLLDTKLKVIIPDLVTSYLESLDSVTQSHTTEDLTIENAVFTILYTLCKVRGNKVIVGFLNNEPRYLEPVLARLETITHDTERNHQSWHTSYILLLWLSHLLLAPFSLASISDESTKVQPAHGIEFPKQTPQVAIRIVELGLAHLPTSTKAQDAAAAMLVRLVARPDMQSLRLADILTEAQIQSIKDSAATPPNSIYEVLGPMRFLTGLTSSADLSHLIPAIYRLCEKLGDHGSFESIRSNTIIQKLLVKALRNIAILSLRASSNDGPLQRLLESTSVLENVIDHLLQSLAARDSSVRYAAAKALSLIIQELESDVGYEVVQAVLDTYKEDIPRAATEFDFRTVDPLKWHGLTLALGYTLFQRTASPDQLPDILTALLHALHFEQRTATGSSIGSNVRDAANFGIWSLARRYSTKELNLVEITRLSHYENFNRHASVIEMIAVHLIISASFDPVGNIRRGSSAALQELVGRHPDQVHEGISLVQIVEYQAIGLRRRAMCDVASRAADLSDNYRYALIDSAFSWRGVGSFDDPSRKAAADAIAALSRAGGDDSSNHAMTKLFTVLQTRSISDVESLHGLVLTLSRLLQEVNIEVATKVLKLQSNVLINLLEALHTHISNCTARVLRADLPASIAQFICALCKVQLQSTGASAAALSLPLNTIDAIVESLLDRHETSVMLNTPAMTVALHSVAVAFHHEIRSISIPVMLQKLLASSSKSSQLGAARSTALAALYPDIAADHEAIVHALCRLVRAANVDWRITGLKALNELTQNISSTSADRPSALQLVCEGIVEGMRDYTIDERGDIGSLVRLQAITCTCTVLAKHRDVLDETTISELHGNVIRTSLEKLDRVRLEAAKCRAQFFPFNYKVTDIASISTKAYFTATLQPFLSHSSQPSLWQMLWSGCISSAGSSAEALLQSCRSALGDILSTCTPNRLTLLFTSYADAMAAMLEDKGNMQPALELLAFLLDIGIALRIGEAAYKWKTLLSIVQKSHYQSSEIPRIVAAVYAYHGLAKIPKIRADTIKKLLSMLKTNPYPRVRMAVVDVLYLVLEDEELLSRDWTSSSAQWDALLLRLRQQHVDGH